MQSLKKHKYGMNENIVPVVNLYLRQKTFFSSYMAYSSWETDQTVTISPSIGSTTRYMQ